MLPIPLSFFALVTLFSFLASYGPSDEIILDGKPVLRLVESQHGKLRLMRTPLITGLPDNYMDDVVVEEALELAAAELAGFVMVDYRNLCALPSPGTANLYGGLLFQCLDQTTFSKLVELVQMVFSLLDSWQRGVFPHLQQLHIANDALSLGLLDTIVRITYANMVLTCTVFMCCFCICTLAMQRGQSTRKDLPAYCPKTPSKRRWQVSPESAAPSPPMHICGAVRPYTTSTPLGEISMGRYTYQTEHTIADSEIDRSVSFSFTSPTVNIINNFAIPKPNMTTLSPILAAVASQSPIAPVTSHILPVDVPHHQESLANGVEHIDPKLDGNTQVASKDGNDSDQVDHAHSPAVSATFETPSLDTHYETSLETTKIDDNAFMEVLKDEADFGFDLFSSSPKVVSHPNEKTSPVLRHVVNHNILESSLAAPSAQSIAEADTSSPSPVAQKPLLATNTQCDAASLPDFPVTPRELPFDSLNITTRSPRLLKRNQVRYNKISATEVLEEDSRRTVWDTVRDTAGQPGSQKLVGLLVKEDLLSGCTAHRQLRRVMSRSARDLRMEEEGSRLRGVSS